MDIDEMTGIKAVAVTGDEVSLIDIYANDYSPYIIIDMDEDDVWQQRAITSDDKLVHVVDAIVAGRYGCGGSCSWAFKVLVEKNGLFEFSKKINLAIKNEYKAKKSKNMPQKRWYKNMHSLIIQLFIWDFDLLDDALEDPEKFITEFVNI